MLIWTLKRFHFFSNEFIQSEFGPTVEQAVISPSGNYIFLAMSNKRDLFVHAYVYDVDSESIHKDCLSGVMTDGRYACNDLFGAFSIDDHIEVHWTDNDILTLTIDGESRQEPFVIQSIEVGKPWQTVSIN